MASLGYMLSIPQLMMLCSCDAHFASMTSMRCAKGT